MANIALGIDTGGTFTDGVIYDLEMKKILRKTKVITTRHDLAGAVDNCLNDLFAGDSAGVDARDIKMLSLSTTLATNAIVEGQGVEVGAILLGFEPERSLPTLHHVSIAGGCTIKGRIKEEVDMAAAEEKILAMKSKVSAFAISGYLSVRNPKQELEVQKLVERLTGYPVVCAHQLSSDLGFQERTVTAILNARLIPLITGLIDAVKEIMDRRSIKAPLMVVKGDGSLIYEKKARERPVETLLSGPAASVVGGMALCDLKSGLVVDMGGTTTDVAVFKDNKTFPNQKGAKVGGWLTRVKAMDLTTIGLGGDSFIQVSKDGKLSIGPQRVFPLAWIAEKHPHVLEELQAIKDEVGFFPLGIQPTVILAHIKDPVNIDLTTSEKQILTMVREKPHTIHHISNALKKDVDILPWHRLVSIGCLHRASLTPTDILHVTDDFLVWNKDAAILGAEIMARRYGTGYNAFINDALEEIYFMGALVLMEVLAGSKDDKILVKEAGSQFFVDEILRKKKSKSNKDIEFSVQANLPIIAVGAPAAAFFPQIGEKLRARVVLPDSAEVANAVGTVCGKIVERIMVMIKPGDVGGFLVHSPNGREGFIEYEDAMEYALEMGKEYVLEQAAISAARDVKLEVNRKDRFSKVPGQMDLEDGASHKVFIESILDIAAIGYPWGDGD